MPKRRKPPRLTWCHLCEERTVNPHDPKLLAVSGFFTRLPGVDPATPIMVGNFTNEGRNYQKIWQHSRQLAKLIVPGICTNCRTSIATAIDLPAAELIPDLSELNDRDLTQEECAELARWAVKTSLLFVAAEPTFVTEKLKHALRQTMRVDRPMPNNIQVSIARIPSHLRIVLSFRNIERFKVPGTISVVSCRNIGILTYVPHQSDLPIAECIPRGDPYWAFVRHFQPVWPTHQILQWPTPEIPDTDIFTADLQRVQYNERQVDPIHEALRKAGLIDPWAG